MSIFLYLCLKKGDTYEVVNNLFGFVYTKKNCNAQGSSKYYLFITAPSFLNSRGEHWYSFLNTLQK